MRLIGKRTPDDALASALLDFRVAFDREGAHVGGQRRGEPGAAQVPQGVEPAVELRLADRLPHRLGVERIATTVLQRRAAPGGGAATTKVSRPEHGHRAGGGDHPPRRFRT